MLSFDRRTVLALLAGLAAAGCRFEPAMRKGRPAASLPGQFEVFVPGDRTAYLLEERLSTRLGSSGDLPGYALMVEFEISEGKAAAGGSGGVDRIALSGTARYTVSDPASTDRLTEGFVRGSVTFSSIEEIIAADAARRDAEQRLVNLIADRIVTRLTMTSGDWVS